MLRASAPSARTMKGSVSVEPAELVQHDRVSKATVRVLGHDRHDRARRALVGLASCWGAAIGAVFLPVLHFVLVPSLVVAGPIVAWSQLRQHLTVLDIEGPCPACAAPIREPLMSDTQTPITIRCESCRRALSVRLPPHLLES